MNTTVKNWSWFIGLLLLLIAAGLYLGRSDRPDPGQSYKYSVAEYRKVNPALITYRELEPIKFSALYASALAIGPNGAVYVGGDQHVTRPGSDWRIELDALPTALTLDQDGLLYVGLRSKIVVYDADGNQQAAWTLPGDQSVLTSLAVDDTWLYAADAGERRIWRYPKAGGEPLEIGGKDADGDHRGFYIPSPFFDVAISPSDGSLWAVNSGYHAFENFRPDGSLLSSWERSGFDLEGFSGCCNPSHMALLPDGGFVTAEKGLVRIKIHEPGGSLRCVVAAPDQFDDGAVGLDLAVDEDGIIYVLDPARAQVRRFKEAR